MQRNHCVLFGLLGRIYRVHKPSYLVGKQVAVLCRHRNLMHTLFRISGTKEQTMNSARAL